MENDHSGLSTTFSSLLMPLSSWSSLSAPHFSFPELLARASYSALFSCRSIQCSLNSCPKVSYPNKSKCQQTKGKIACLCVYVCVCVCVNFSVVSDSLWPHGLWSTRLLCPWDSPGKNTGVGCPNPGIKPGSPASQVDSLPLEPPRKP